MNSEQLIEQAQKLFGSEVVQKKTKLLKMPITHSQLDLVLPWLRQNGISTLGTITCTDWIEEGNFHINYIMQSVESALMVMVGFDIPRDGGVLKSWSSVWPQSETFERELHEMYGIEIEGHPEMRDFMLEGWTFTPPMRREFDTKAFVEEHYEVRPGREDACDVKMVLKAKAAAKKALEVETNE